jgi:hypothetical protein
MRRCKNGQRDNNNSRHSIHPTSLCTIYENTKRISRTAKRQMAVSAISLAIVIGSIALGLLMTAGITKND